MADERDRVDRVVARAGRVAGWLARTGWQVAGLLPGGEAARRQFRKAEKAVVEQFRKRVDEGRTVTGPLVEAGPAVVDGEVDAVRSAMADLLRLSAELDRAQAHAAVRPADGAAVRSRCRVLGRGAATVISEIAAYRVRRRRKGHAPGAGRLRPHRGLRRRGDAYPRRARPEDGADRRGVRGTDQTGVQAGRMAVDHRRRRVRLHGR